MSSRHPLPPNHHKTKPESWSAMERLKFLSSEKEHTGLFHKIVIAKDLLEGRFQLENYEDESLIQGLEKLSWKPSFGKVTMALASGLVTVIPAPRLKTFSSRLALGCGLEAADVIRKYKSQSVHLVLPKDWIMDNFLSGFLNGLYQTSYFKSANEDVFMPENLSASEALSPEVKTLAMGEHLCRLMGNAPENWMDSEKFAKISLEVAEEIGASCKIMGRKEILDLGMGLFAAVAAASEKDPKFIILDLPGRLENESPLVFVGKGVTFDTGGISLKPASSMMDMKCDLCGAASILGAAYALGKIGPARRIVCLLGVTENAIGPHGVKPGDIVKAMNGKTVEILNSDAEGRLILGDLLHYAEVHYKPHAIFDVATLTGGVSYALGSVGAGFVTTEDSLAHYIESASFRIGELLWRLPLWSDWEKEVKSDIADLKNIAGPQVRASCSMGGMFLKEFVQSPWAHLDIANVAFQAKSLGLPSQGASGFGVKLLVELSRLMDEKL